MYHEYSTPATPCPGCGTLDTPSRGPGAGPHFARLTCAGCLVFLRWLPKPRPLEGTVRHG